MILHSINNNHHTRIFICATSCIQIMSCSRQKYSTSSFQCTPIRINIYLASIWQYNKTISSANRTPLT